VPLRVLLVTRVFHPHIGGIERHVEWLAAALLGRGHHVEVLTLDRGFADGARYPSESRLDTPAGPLRVRRVPWAGSARYPLAPAAVSAFRGWDVVHVHGVDFLVDAAVATRRWHRAAVVLSTHGAFFHTDFAQNLKKWWFAHVTRRLVGRLDGLLFTSTHDAAMFAAITDRGVVAPNAVDLGPWLTLARAPEPGRFVTTGRVDVHKGLDDLLRTLAIVRRIDPRPFHAHVVGPEVAEGLVPRLRRQARELGVDDRVTFHGKVRFAALRDAVARAELALFPSTYESFGISVVEAMAAGVVPVVRDIGAFRDLVTDGQDGFVAPFGDASAAAERIVLARDAARAPAVAAAARAAASRHGWDSVIGGVEAAYRDAMAHRSSAADTRTSGGYSAGA
jgi:alpha-1,3-mannosyltransferase